MTDTIDAAPAAPVADSPSPDRRNLTMVVLAVIATVAVVALALVAILAVTDDDRHTMMDGSGAMPGSMMGPGGMMDGAMPGHRASSPTVLGARQIAVASRTFRFTPNEIHVGAGEDVTIVLTTTDIPHDFTVDELDLHVVATPGRPGTGGFRAPSEPGRYAAYCAVAGHREAGMTATLVVDA